jgi:hypothetical protein
MKNRTKLALALAFALGGTAAVFAGDVHGNAYQLYVRHQTLTCCCRHKWFAGCSLDSCVEN